MSRPAPDRRRLLGAIATLAAGGLAGGCAGGAAVPPPAGAEPLALPSPRVGDRWSYRLTNRFNGGTIGETTVEVLEAGATLRLRVDPGDGQPAQQERYADAWRVIEETTFDGPIVFDVPMPLVPPDARTGAAVATAGRYRSERASGELAWRQRLRAVGWERVTVPAGTFDALRIDRAVNFEHPDRFRLMPERTDILWVSPQVGRWVAREWTGSFMPGSPSGRAGRAREDWIRWALVGWQAGGRGG
ncbi:MAG: hypothetical protein RJA99_2676 [Pseudomonadota bacterium]|jgi:hypothetical protein